MHTHKTHKKQPDTNQAASQKQSAANKGPAQLKADTLGLPTGLKAGVEHLRANKVTAEAPIQPMPQAVPGEPWHIQQLRQAPTLSAGGQPVQRVTDELKQNDISEPMDKRWQTAYPKMQQLINSSTFGQSSKHSILLWAGSNKSPSGLSSAYGVTYLYMSNDDLYSGYSSGDYGNFTQIAPPYNFLATPNRAYRIVILINLSLNRTVEELYTTFLHEWYIHAVPWMRDVQSGTNVTSDPGTREDDEHKTYANKSDNDLDGFVTSLNLSSGAGKVHDKLKNDRDRYSKSTGKFLG